MHNLHSASYTPADTLFCLLNYPALLSINQLATKLSYLRIINEICNWILNAAGLATEPIKQCVT